MTWYDWLLLLIGLAFFTPYNVDRPARHTPVVTYALIGISVFIFLLTVMVSNVELGADRVAGQRQITEIIAQYGNQDPAAKAYLDRANMVDAASGNAPDNATSDSAAGPRVQQLRHLAQQYRWRAALILATKHAADGDGYQRIYQIENAYSSVVLEPHYSVLNIFAYRPADPSFWGKLIGLIGSMFLHSGLLHIAFNMLYLWVFGRALEESLGSVLYGAAYFLSGVAATLLHHIMTMEFTPASAAVPAMGASGAIAGVLGLFVLRFYRTPVRIFFIVPTTWPILGVGGLLATIVLALLTHSIRFSLIAGFGGVLLFLVCFGRRWAWSTFSLASAWVIGIWVVALNVIPGLTELFSPEQSGGVAHWAHIGGWMFGMAYGLLIGSKHEGAKEYLLEDAQKAMAAGDAQHAITYAENLLLREPHNAGAYEVMARGFERLKNKDAALENYEIAIGHYIQSGARDQAARVYLDVLSHHARFILPPKQQLVVGTQMARSLDYRNAAETLVKIPNTFPDAPECEVTLLRSAQLYLDQLKDPQTAAQLLHTFLQRYPQSEWLPQAQRALKMAATQTGGTPETSDYRPHGVL